MAERDVQLALAGIRLDSIWRGMQQRVNNTNSPAYKDYGGRGIEIEWGSFQAFLKDMLPTYEDGLTLDRVDNNGNYSKDNCRWATKKEQANNRRTNVYIEYMGEQHTVEEWAEILGISSSSLRQRLYVYKWTIDKIMTTPIRKWSRRTI